MHLALLHFHPVKIPCNPRKVQKCRVQLKSIRITMSEYRFHLQKYKYGSKISCPSCGKPRCFVKYVDAEGEIAFPDNVGKCDHENSCGYHYTLKEYFKDNDKLEAKEFRDLSGLSRNQAIVILEYLDRKNITKRVEDYRILV